MLHDVIARALNVPVGSVTDDSSPDTMRRWDSLRHLDLMMAVEDAYGVQFSTADIVLAKSVRDIRRLLRDRGREAD